MMSGDNLRLDRSLGGLGKDDQLDRLLAGLDELSGTLPDLGRSAGVHQSAGVNHQLVNNHYQSLNQRNQLSASRETSILSDCPDNLPNRRVSDLTKQMSDAARRLSDNSRRLSNDSRHGSENVRTYEDDLDYVLEKEPRYLTAFIFKYSILHWAGWGASYFFLDIFLRIGLSLLICSLHLVEGGGF